MVGARWEQTSAAEARHQTQLGEDVLARVGRRQVVPEAEAADRLQRRSVVQHAAADPRDSIETLLVGGRRIPLRQVIEIGGVVRLRPCPCLGARPDCLRRDLTVPELDRLLVWPDVVHVAQADHGAADEADGVTAQGVDESLHQVRLDDHVVIEIEDGRRPRLLEQELALLGHAAARHVAHHRDRDAAHRQETQYRLQLGAPRERVVVRRLVGHDDAQRPVALSRQAGEGHGQRVRAVAGRDQDVDRLLPVPVIIYGLLPRVLTR